jgi:RNA polymerase II subunit A small phosphatase-like protein
MTTAAKISDAAVDHLAALQIPTTTIVPGKDGDVIQPPTPTKQLSPEDDAGGVMSGSVTPPGATTAEAQTAHRQDNLHDSEDESEGTSYDDEEMDESTPMDEAEDEETRLIINGGAGIPIGPVSVSFLDHS